jgi:hypothetical protein
MAPKLRRSPLYLILLQAFAAPAFAEEAPADVVNVVIFGQGNTRQVQDVSKRPGAGFTWQQPTESPGKTTWRQLPIC